MDSKSRKETSILRTRHLLMMFSLALLTLGLPDRARAQAIQAPRIDIFAGYSYLHSTTAIIGEPIDLHGGSISAAFYLNRWLGVVGDVGVYHAGDIANQFSLTVSSYQLGPRLRFPNQTRFTPYGQFLLGGGHAGGSLYTSSLGSGLAPIGANNSFVYTVGGGADCRLSDKISIRILQAESLRSEFLNGSIVGHQQNNFRLTTGVVFNFGKT